MPKIRRVSPVHLAMRPTTMYGATYYYVLSSFNKLHTSTNASQI